MAAETTPLLRGRSTGTQPKTAIQGEELENSDKRPWGLHWRSSKFFIVFTITAAIFVDTVLYAVVVPVFPFALKTRAGIASEDIQWWSSFLFAIFGVVGLIASPICGYYADRTTQRRLPFLIGLILAAIGVALFGIARDPWTLALSRVCQALASTIAFSVGLAVIGDTVPKGEAGASMGVALSGISAGYILSPTLGGLVYDSLGYGAVVVMCALLLLVDVVLRLLMIEKKTAAAFTANDTEAAAAITPENAQASETSRRRSSIVTDIVSTLRDIKTKRQLPLILQFFVTPRFFAAFFSYCIYVSVLVAYDAVLALYVKRRFGWNAAYAGMIYLALAIPALSAPWVGHWAERTNARLWAIAGFVAATPLQAALMMVDDEGPWEIYLLVVLLVFLGLCLTLVGTPLASEMSNCVSSAADDNPEAFEGYTGGGYAQAFSLLNCANAVGLLVGPTVGGVLVDSKGWKIMCIGLSAMTFAGAIPSIMLEMHRLSRRKPTQRSDA